jgi:hypothetical protein
MTGNRFRDEEWDQNKRKSLNGGAVYNFSPFAANRRGSIEGRHHDIRPPGQRRWPRSRLSASPPQHTPHPSPRPITSSS